MFTHPNHLDIPTERIEEALRQGAIPGFWGEIRIEVRLNPAAALEIDLLAERKTVTQGDTVRENSTIVAPSNERVSKVKMKMAELREVFHLSCPVTEIKASFKDGHLINFVVTELKQILDLPSPRMRFAGGPASAK